MAHFIDIHDHSAAWIARVLEVSRRLLEDRRQGVRSPVLAGRTLAMLFEKPSLRTRVSFEQAMLELGGSAIVLGSQEVGLGKRESTADVARVLSGMVHGIMARVFEHQKLLDMAAASSVPVINALSDHSHPCQALADILTLQQEFGNDLTGRTLVFVGDGNNVARSLARICVKLGLHFTLSAPAGYRFTQEELAAIASENPRCRVQMIDDPRQAVRDADALYTDTFVSMGQEAEKEERLKVFAAYQVNESLIACAPKHAVVLHCLPAYRGIEITDGAMDGSQSRVFPQAHNRLHAQKGLLAVLLGGV